MLLLSLRRGYQTWRRLAYVGISLRESLNDYKLISLDEKQYNGQGVVGFLPTNC